MMIKPYEVKGKLFPILTFEGDPILQYGMFGFSSAIRQAKLLNIAFSNGVMKTCTIAENGEELFNKIFQK